MVHGAYFRPQMVTWSHILVALDVYPRPINASTECCCAFLSIVTNGFRTVVVFTIGLFLYHGSLVTDFRPCLVVWVYGVVAPSWSWWEKLEGMDWNHTQDVKCVGCLGGKWSPYMLIAQLKFDPLPLTPKWDPIPNPDGDRNTCTNDAKHPFPPIHPCKCVG